MNALFRVFICSVLRLAGTASDYIVAYDDTLTISLKAGSGLGCGE